MSAHGWEEDSTCWSVDERPLYLNVVVGLIFAFGSNLSVSNGRRRVFNVELKFDYCS